MLPDPHHLPASLSKHLVNVSIPLTIRLDLFSPEFRVLSCRTMMIRASVPVAAIHKHRDSGPGEHDVGGASHISEGTC